MLFGAATSANPFPHPGAAHSYEARTWDEAPYKYASFFSNEAVFSICHPFWFFTMLAIFSIIVFTPFYGLLVLTPKVFRGLCNYRQKYCDQK